VLVMHDLLGLSDGAPPKFVRQYVGLGDIARRAAELWADDVRNQKYPSDAESY
jgi:3-methyl-2-oxobutanoate hydroxymethyltransferase